ncbi:hypothetical protein TNCV_3225661 [Trichonephila clavipes]|nr:hypothetical protein TNCV_3225661 [Trichonephila clavipes]
MAYLGKGRREDLFVLATELNLKFDKSMTIATLKDLIIGSENWKEELTKTYIQQLLRIAKTRRKFCIEEQRKEKNYALKNEKKRVIRFEQLRLDEQKRKDEFELES